MTLTRLRLRALTIGLLVLLLAPNADTAPTNTVLDDVASAVFRVRCKGQSGSGFAWGEGDTVVTAYHVVAACGTDVEVRSASRNATRQAKVERVLKNRDLALLRIAQVPTARWTVKPLPNQISNPSVGETLTVMGHPLGIPSVQAATVKRLWGGKKIEDLVPPSVHKELKSLGWPDLEADVHPYGSGHIAPAHSGSPIIDDQGRVVSIAQGGLQNGAVEIAWGIPASNLAALAQSSTNWNADAVPRVTALFADSAVPQARQQPAFRCGTTALNWIRKQPLREIAASTDDPNGLQVLVNTLTNNGMQFDAYALEFDIYRDLDSGGTIVVPAGLPIRQAPGDLCIADDPAWGLTLAVQVDRVQDLAHAEQVARLFELRVLMGYQAYVDPAFSYLQPVRRWDGLLANRKSLILHSWVQPIPGMPPHSIPTAYFFETLATRANGALAFAVTKRDVAFDTWCANRGAATNPRCARVGPRQRRYAHMALGVHLSTFPPG